MNLLAQIARRRALEKICGKPKATASRQGALDFGAPAAPVVRDKGTSVGAALTRMIDRLAAAGNAVELTTEVDLTTAGRLRGHGYIDIETTQKGRGIPRYFVQLTPAGQEVAEGGAELAPELLGRPRKAAKKKAAKKPAAAKKKAAKKKAAKKGPSKAALWWLSILNTAALDLATKPELKRTASKGGAYFGNAKEKRGVRELVEHKLARITLEEPASKGSVAAIYALPTPAGLRAYRDGAYAKHGAKAPTKKPRGKKRAASTLRMDDKIRVTRWGADTTTDARIYSVFPKGKMQIDFELEDAEGDRFMWSAGPTEKVEVIG